jgi:hypothetical protein
MDFRRFCSDYWIEIHDADEFGVGVVGEKLEPVAAHGAGANQNQPDRLSARRSLVEIAHWCAVRNGPLYS